MRFQIDATTVLNLLIVFVPLAMLGHVAHWSPPVIFGFTCLGIIPLAGLMGKATEHLADRVGEGPGALLNATFGNACEFIIGLAALRAGYFDIVKASLTGSIIGNILLVLGASILAGGIKYQTQLFNRTAATASSTLLALAAISLVVPAVFHHSGGKHVSVNEDDLAIAISAILLLTYIASLYFALKTHKHLYIREFDDEAQAAIGVTGWSVKASLTILLVTTILVAILSEILVHEVELVAQHIGMSHTFIGVVVVAIIGNAAEHSTAVLMALKNKMDLAINIALGSGSQIALFVAPMLVFIGAMIGKPMDLSFTPFEVLSVAVSVIILAYVALDGESNWLEGVQLLAVYAILGCGFFFA